MSSNYIMWLKGHIRIEKVEMANAQYWQCFLRINIIPKEPQYWKKKTYALTMAFV